MMKALLSKTNLQILIYAVIVCAQFPLSGLLFAQQPVVQFDFDDQRVHSVAFSPDGKLLAAGNFRGELRLWDLSKRKEIQTVAAHELRINFLEFIDEGKSLLSVDNDGAVKIWTVPTLEAKSGFTSSTTYTGAISPDGKQLLIGSFGKASSLELPGGKVRQDFSHETAVLGAAFSPDGKQLVTASEKSIKYWDSQEGKALGELPLPKESLLLGLAMTSDGKYVAAGTEGRIILVWDMAQKRGLTQFLLGPGEIFQTLEFSPDNQTLAVGNDVADVYLFRLGAPNQTKKWKTAACDVLKYSADGSLLATGGMTVESKGRVQVWRVARPIQKRK